MLFAPLPLFAQSATLDPDVNNDGIVNYLDISRASSCYLRDVALASPALSITSPADGTSITTTSIELTGTVSDNAEELSVNGVATAFSAGSYSTTVSGLTSGDNVIEVVAVARSAPDCWDVDFDASGTIEIGDIFFVYGSYGQSGFPTTAPVPPERTATATITVTLDDVAPVVDIVSPQDGALILAGSVDVSGTVDDPTATVTVNGQVAAVTNGNWTLPALPLAAGENVITAVASDAAGNSSSDSVTVTRIVDQIAPVVVITSPVDGLETFDPSIDISGAVDDPTAVLDINGIPVDIVNGEFNLTGLPLIEGVNTIVANASDGSGNVGTDQVSVTRIVDNDAPVVVITSPADGAFTVARATRGSTRARIRQPGRRSSPLLDSDLSVAADLGTVGDGP